MIHPEPGEMLVRGVALYLPILVTIALALHRRPGRARITAAVLATAWNIPALLALNVIAVATDWWSFGVTSAAVAGVPADLWIGWALLWGAVPILATTSRLVLAAAALIAVDLVLMPLGAPVVTLHSTWLVGEAVAVATCLVPGLLLGRWTDRHEHVQRRAALQVVAFSGSLFFVLPSLAFTVTGESWAPLLQRPRWSLVLVGLAVAPVAAAAVQAVREFAEYGGTPVPLDPPTGLVTTGPYAYVANPMQLSATILLATWGLLLASAAVVAAAAMGAAFSAGIAAWTEDAELAERAGAGWRTYRRQVRLWLPCWRSDVHPPAVVYAATGCKPCSAVGNFIARQRPTALDVVPAEESPQPLERITYRSGDHTSVGVAAIGRSLEHVNLAWAAASWIARLPGVEQMLQLITDAIGGEPRAVRPASD